MHEENFIFGTDLTVAWTDANNSANLAYDSLAQFYTVFFLYLKVKKQTFIFPHWTPNAVKDTKV